MRVQADLDERAQGATGAGDDLLTAHATVAATLGFGVTALWMLADRGYFWPVWVWFGLGALLSLHWLLQRTARRSADLFALPEGERSRVEILLSFSVPLLVWTCILLGVIWLMTGAGSLWPRWPWFALLFLAAIEVYAMGRLRRRRESSREAELSERVGTLERTRRGALEVQAEELRRVERDLHDGAQSRLVALAMKLGRAEAKLGREADAEAAEEVARLLREAREEAGAAITELRDLARGIAPPVLADRGLEAAVRSLASRATGPVQIEADIPQRPAAVLETAAYFVVAEAMTNAAKHAPGAALRVKLELTPEQLLVEVADNGSGGANPSGSGLDGLRRRVEALDGTLAVNSPPGIGTAVAAAFPLERARTVD